jgi:hypothetical protein
VVADAVPQSIRKHMPASGLIIEGIEKYFPVPQSCCRAWLNPFAPPTHPALLGVSFEVGADEVAALIGAQHESATQYFRSGSII